jgi:hypothetical protein
VATKRGKQSGAKTTKTKPGKTTAAPKASAKPAPTATRAPERPAPVPAKTHAAPKPSAKPAPAAERAPERRVPVPVVAPARREVAPPSLLDQAKALRDAVQQSKLTARDPWGYTAKARAWQERVEQLLDRITTNVDAAATRKGVEALRAEIEGDRDYQEAQRRS